MRTLKLKSAMRVQYEPDPGLVEIAPGVALPQKFSAAAESTNDNPVAISVEVLDGIPRCVALEVRGTVADVRLPVQAWLDEVCARAAWRAPRPKVWIKSLSPDPAEGSALTAGVQASTRRRSVDDDVLRRAAAAHAHAGIPGVVTVMHVSEATAYRYLRKARERGFAPPRED